MDQVLPRILKFDQFELDLLRGCARVAGDDLDLRPKAFLLLCYLAENAGRLASKQELHDAVWGRVAVSDDALVQCIRELRQKLGDVDRTLIRTIPRRGYLLNATTCAPDAAALPKASTTRPQPWDLGKPAAWAAAILIAALALASFPVARVVHPTPPDLVSVEEARHLATLAAEKELPLPAFHITSRAEDVPDTIRRFVGVWVSDTGWQYSDRQLMVIITSVTKGGNVSGYFVNGPSKPYSRTKGPAFMMSFKGHINAGTMRYDGYVGMYLANLDREGSMEFKLIFKDGVTTVARLKPVWTLPKNGRTESAERTPSGASTQL
jgi:DNA-binding winged helix-turn-helix (wHTH) protein